MLSILSNQSHKCGGDKQEELVNSNQPLLLRAQEQNLSSAFILLKWCDNRSYPLTISISILNPSRIISMSIKSLDLFFMNMNSMTAIHYALLETLSATWGGTVRFETFVLWLFWWTKISSPQKQYWQVSLAINLQVKRVARQIQKLIIHSLYNNSSYVLPE